MILVIIKKGRGGVSRRLHEGLGLWVPILHDLFVPSRPQDLSEASFVWFLVAFRGLSSKSKVAILLSHPALLKRFFLGSGALALCFVQQRVRIFLHFGKWVVRTVCCAQNLAYSLPYEVYLLVLEDPRSRSP